MLPTPSTTHINPSLIYPPAEDSYLLLDTLASTSQRAFLTQLFPPKDPTPLILEVGTGSGVILAFIAANAKAIFGRGDVLVLGGDVNVWACEAAGRTVVKACHEACLDEGQESDGGWRGREGEAALLGMMCADLMSPLRNGVVDVLVFNPPYVPSGIVPGYEVLMSGGAAETGVGNFEYETRMLELSYEGGVDGMEVTNRLLEQLPVVLSKERGVAYVLLCQQNRPEEVMRKIGAWGEGWEVDVVGRSGRQAGWEKLVVIRIWRS